MQVNTEILKNGLGELKLIVEVEDYRDAVNNELKNLRKKAQIKGFRAGMVPMGMIKKMYGKAVMGDELNKILEKHLNEFLQNTEWDVMSNPLMTESDLTQMDFNREKDITFTFHVPIKPEINITLFEDSDKTFDHYKIEVSDETLNEEIERLQKQHGTTEEVEDDIEETDSLEVTFQELDEEGNVKENGIESSSWISTDMLKEEGPQESLLALKRGDHLDLNIYEDFDRDENQISSVLLGLDRDDEGDFLETSGKFRMTIETVKRLRKAAIDRELYMTVFGIKDDTVQESADEETAIVNPSDDIPAEVTPEFFKEKIKESLESQYNERTDMRLWSDVKAHISTTTEVELAEEPIRQIWLNNPETKEVEDKEAAFSAYLESMKWSVILSELAKKYEIEVSDNDIIMGAVREVSALFRMYGGGQQIPEDMLKQLVEGRLKDAEYVRNMSVNVTEQKLIGVLKDDINMNTTSMSFDDYNDMLQKESEALTAEPKDSAEDNEALDSETKNESVEQTETPQENEPVEDTVVVVESDEESQS